MSLADHYADAGLAGRIRAALPPEIKPESIAPLDEFHIRGLDATLELIQLSEFREGDHILDIGSGLGGPARMLSRITGAKVTGVDLTPAFVDIANELSERLNMGDRTYFQVGNAVDLPFGPASFEGAWMQHVSMNIADKGALFRGIDRVLKPGGRLVCQEVVQLAPDVAYPTPWASDARQSFLASADGLREAISDAGFEVLVWKEDTERAIAWFEDSKDEPIPPLSLRLMMGEHAVPRFKNVYKNLKEAKIGVILAVLQSKRARP